MKILHYVLGLPPVRTGGLPKYALDLMDEQKKLGHQVSMLLPGVIKNEDSSKVSIKKWKKKNGIVCYCIKNPIYIPNGSGINQPEKFMPVVNEKIYFGWLREKNPDVIHVHSLMGLHKEFFQAAKKLKIRMVFTTHDYFGLCPKIDCMNGNAHCHTHDWANCTKCCENATVLRRLKLEQSNVYRRYCESKYLMNIVHSEALGWTRKLVSNVIKKQSVIKDNQGQSNDEYRILEINSQSLVREYRALQQYYLEIFNLIDCYHFNSDQTKQVFEGIIGKRNGKVVPVMNRSICDKRQKRQYKKELRLGYLGTPTYMKGYYYLLQESQKLYESGRRDFCLNTYFWEIEEKQSYISNYHPFTEEQQEEVYAKMDVLVVPSLWKETFGMVVLEALSYGVPVLLSENVGAKMMVEDYKGCCRMFLPEEGKLFNILKEIYDDRKILEEMNQCILNQIIEFDYRKNVEEVMALYE